MPNLFNNLIWEMTILYLSSPRRKRAAYCILHGPPPTPPPPPPPPPPHLFDFKIAVNLAASASSFFTKPSHTTVKLFWRHIDPHIINTLIIMAIDEETLVSEFQEDLANMLSYVSQPDYHLGANNFKMAV